MVGDASVVGLELEAVGVEHEQGNVGEKIKRDTIDIQERPKMEKE